MLKSIDTVKFAEDFVGENFLRKVKKKRKRDSELSRQQKKEKLKRTKQTTIRWIINKIIFLLITVHKSTRKGHSLCKLYMCIVSLREGKDLCCYLFKPCSPQ